MKLIDDTNNFLKAKLKPTTESDDQLARVTTRVRPGTSKRVSQKAQALSRPSKRQKVQD